MRAKRQPLWGLLYTLTLLALFAVYLFAARRADAADVTWTWANPTTNTDGTAIPATGAGSLASGRLEFGTCAAGGAFGTKAGEMPVTQAQVTARTATMTNVLPSTICARLMVSNTFARESAPSNVATVTVQPSTPGPPSGFSGVTVNVTVTVTP